jgi:hypothetical protein
LLLYKLLIINELECGMENVIKPIGIVHIKGVNDREYAEHIQKLKLVKEQVMISIIENRW